MRPRDDRRTQDRDVLPEMPEGALAMRCAVLPEQLALREPRPGHLQAMRIRTRGVREEVLQQVDHVLC